MTASNPNNTRRFVTDARLDSQIAYLQSAYVLCTGELAPASQLVRRAVALLADHVSKLVEEGRRSGAKGMSTQDAARERLFLTAFSRLTDASKPVTMTNEHGQVSTYSEAIVPSLAIPTGAVR
jgi:hypothetical protein